jgi:hypothetical protein
MSPTIGEWEAPYSPTDASDCLYSAALIVTGLEEWAMPSIHSVLILKADILPDLQTNEKQNHTFLVCATFKIQAWHKTKTSSVDVQDINQNGNLKSETLHTAVFKLSVSFWIVSEVHTCTFCLVH